MAANPPPASRNDFEIAIICALPLEADAVETSFDEYWDNDGDKYGKATGDPNAYTTGRIGRHNVVLAWMPGMGKTSAASVACSLRSSFSNIRLALVTGICGGVPNGPNNEYIVLGDVVISDGIIEYDFGRQFPGIFIRKDTLNDNLGKPNNEIRAILAKLKGLRGRQRLLTKTLQYLGPMQENLGHEWNYPGASQDMLFEPNYRHKHHDSSSHEICKDCNAGSDEACEEALGLTCKQLGCADTQLVSHRQERNKGDNDLKIHYGLMASGSAVMKSGEHRDRISAQEKVIAFEMEGAGVWDNFPCVVIKGVCDYADSHKNKKWQNYAAATAATASKAFLNEWTPTQKEASVSAISNVSDANQTSEECLKSLSFPEMNYRREEITDNAPNSSAWLFQHDSYKHWLLETHSLLWITGKPGSGKSTLMKFIYNTFDQDGSSNTVHLTFFFHSRGTELQQTSNGMLRTILYQLLEQVPTAMSYILKLFADKREWYGKPRTDWDWKETELRQSLKSGLITAAETRSIVLFVDALDEGGEESARSIVRYLDQINDSLNTAKNSTKICFSCRHFPVLTINKGYKFCLEDENSDDISCFAHRELIQGVVDTPAPSTLTPLLESITEKASGVFLWVTLVMQRVINQYNEGDSLNAIQDALSEVPSDLRAVFQQILERLKNSNRCEQSLHLMQWICLARRPLTIAELRHALASDDSVIRWPQNSVEDSPGFVEDDARMTRLILSLSGGLAEVNHRYQEDSVQFIHQSVVEFLLKSGLSFMDRSPTQDAVGKGHDRLSRASINYLKMGQLERIYRSPITRQDPASDSLPFIKYALEYWPSHSQLAERGGFTQASIIERLEWPKEYYFCRWVTLRKVYNIYDALEYAKDGSTLAHVAAASGIWSIMEKLLQISDCIDSEDYWGTRPLHLAARYGNLEIVKMLINAGAKINNSNQYDQTPLERAASGGHENILRLLLERGANIGNVINISSNALTSAANFGSVSVVRLLLDSGADVNAQGGPYGNTLQAAAYKGHEDIVRLLLDHGADVNAQSGHYGNALQAAAFEGHEGIVSLLLNQGADVNTQGGPYKNALQAATSRGNEDIVRLLLDHGADVNAQGGPNGNALQASAFEGHEDIVRLLLDHRAGVNAQGGQYGNALQASAFEGHEDIVRLLLDHGADVNSQGRPYGNALQAAASRGHEDIVRLLLGHGADVNAQGGHYKNALQTAAYKGHEDIVRLLLDHGADVNAQSGHYGNALQAAAFEGHEGIVRLLLDHRAGVNAQGGQYGNALQASAFEGHEDIVRLLLDHGADVNAQGGPIGNALQAATSRGHEDIVRLLLDKDADPSVEDFRGRKAFHRALEVGNWKLALLLQHTRNQVWSNQDKLGCSSLHFAASGNCVEALEVILDSGVDINSPDTYGWTAAHWTARKGSEKFCIALKEAGSDFNIRDFDGRTASDIAIYCDHNRLCSILDGGFQMISEIKIAFYERLYSRFCSSCNFEIIGPYSKCDHGDCSIYYILCFRCMHDRSKIHPQDHTFEDYSTRMVSDN